MIGIVEYRELVELVLEKILRDPTDTDKQVDYDLKTKMQLIKLSNAHILIPQLQKATNVCNLWKLCYVCMKLQIGELIELSNADILIPQLENVTSVCNL